MVFFTVSPPHFWRLKTSKITYLEELKILMSVFGKISPINKKKKNKFSRVLKALLQASRNSLNTSSQAAAVCIVCKLQHTHELVEHLFHSVVPQLHFLLFLQFSCCCSVFYIQRCRETTSTTWQRQQSSTLMQHNSLFLYYS